MLERLTPLFLAGLLFCGCPADDDDDVSGDVEVTDFGAVVSDTIATVVTVSWTTDVPTVGNVEFGPGESYSMATAVESEYATEHVAYLVGLPAETSASYRILVEAEDGGTGQANDVVTTGSLSGDLPQLTVSGDGHDGFLAVPLIGAFTGPTVIDAQGNLVWFWPESRELEVYRVRPSVDGRSMLYNAASVSGDPSEESELMRIAMDGSEVSSIPISLLAHDFVEHPDGTLAAIVVEYREEGEDTIRGDQLVEVSPDGTQTVVWSAWDCFDPAETQHAEVDFGWTFANALDYDPVEDAYYLGIRNFSSIARIPRSTFECEWVIGDIGATQDVTSGTPFMHEHQFQMLDDGVLIFDNDGAPGMESRAVEYEVDLDAGTVEQVWSYSADPVIYSFVLGDVHRFDDGDTLVTWSTGGQIDRVDAAGELVWQLNTEMGYAVAFDTVLDSLYP